MSAKAESGTLKGEINVTPLVDVCLVLLIIFMVVTPFLTPGKPVALPAARNPATQPQGKGVLNLSVEANGVLWLDQMPLSPSEMAMQLRDAQETNPDAVLLVQADRSLDCGTVKGVFQTARDAGFKKVGLVAQRVDAQGLPLAGSQ